MIVNYEEKKGVEDMTATVYKINELFETIQGEGSFTGQPSIFIRLQGCPVACSWCDTKHTWEINLDQQVSASDMLNKAQATIRSVFFIIIIFKLEKSR